MAAIYIESATEQRGEWFDYPRSRIIESSRCDAFGSHRIVHSPENADVVLFATNYSFVPVGLGILKEKTYRRNFSRSILFDSGDEPSPIVGGLCASWPGYDTTPGFARGWCYHHPTSAEATMARHPWKNRPLYLWSFMGSRITDPVRVKVIQSQDAEAFVEDTSERSLQNLMRLTPATEQRHFLEKYVSVVSNSAFIVCPRGKGASSMRIFEAMRAGRAPVIISDTWTPPPYVTWEECSLRLPESEVANLPDFIRQHRSEAETLGNRAYEEWNRVFGPSGLFHHTTEASWDIVASRTNDFKRQYLRRCQFLLKSPWRRHLLRTLKQQLQRVGAHRNGDKM